MQRVAHSRGNHVQVRSPHVAAHKLHPTDHLLTQGCQAPAQGRLGAPLAHPQQPPTMTVNLVDHRQEIVRSFTPAPVNLVHSDGLDADQLSVRQAPFHKPFHRAINTFPTGAKGPRRLAPRQPPRPPRKKTHHGNRHRPLAIAPGHMFHHHPMLRALDPPGGVKEPYHQAPQRHKQPRARRQLVITGGRFETPRAFAANACVRQNDNLKVAGPVLLPAVHANIRINKAGKRLNLVQNGLNFQLHRWSLVGWFVFDFNHKLNRFRLISDAFSSSPKTPARRFKLKRATGRACEPPARARLRSNVSTHLTGTSLLPTNHATQPYF